MTAMTIEQQTYRDHLNVIGGTFATGQTSRDRRWNRFYFKTYAHVVGRMLGPVSGGVLLDVGTSHGYWLSFWRRKGFERVLGVELHAGRAEQARRSGYDDVYCCDAAAIPHPSNSVDAVVSNDVFVHLLRVEDKIAVLKEMERVAKPGGIVILNHPMSPAFGLGGHQVKEHCSFLTLHDFMALIMQQTTLEIQDVKPTYYHFRRSRYYPTWLRLLRGLIILPFATDGLWWLTHVFIRNCPLSDSDVVYLQARKRHG